TAFAFLLASALGAMAQEADQPAKVAAVPVEAPASQPPQASSSATDEAVFPSLDPADRAIAEKIRELLAGGSEQIFAGSEERQKVEAFYQKRQFAPLWLEKAVENARKASVASRLEHADADGLNVADYKITSFVGSADALAEAELRLTQAVLTYARHLQAGRFFRHQIKYQIRVPQ